MLPAMIASAICGSGSSVVIRPLLKLPCEQIGSAIIQVLLLWRTDSCSSLLQLRVAEAGRAVPVAIVEHVAAAVDINDARMADHLCIPAARRRLDADRCILACPA